MRLFAPRVALESGSGDVIRHIPGPMAKCMVAANAAEISNQNGKVKAIRLVATAASYAQRIGEPSPPGWNFGVRFIRRERLDQSGSIVWTFKRIDPPE
jgi:hypothetical protein